MIPPQSSPINWTAVGAIGVITVNITGWIVVHLLTKRREKRRDQETRQHTIESEKTARKRVFIGSLKAWKSEVFSAVHAGAYSIPSEQAYRDGIPKFIDAVELVRDIFDDRQRFDTLTKRVDGLQEKDWNKKQPRDVICGAIDELIQFVEH